MHKPTLSLFDLVESPIASLNCDGNYLDALYEDWKPARPTIVFATYWYFAVARQEVFFQRVCNRQSLQTQDAILAKHRFTNAYRASDKVSQFLINHVIYSEDIQHRSTENTFFRILLFKIFNKIETWQLLEKAVGTIEWDNYSFSKFDHLLEEEMRRKKSIFSAAYIMPSGTSTFGNSRKHQNYLRLIEKMMNDRLPDLIKKADSLKQVFEILRSYPMLGDFLAYQFAIDLNYSPLLSFEENTFVVAGPGARDGISKCFSTTGGQSNEEIIFQMATHQEREIKRLGLTFRSLWGRPLQPIDCQNLFCETSKYARLAHPDVPGVSGRKRIKQIYRPEARSCKGLDGILYPPKWGINDAVRATLNGHGHPL